MLKVVAFVNGIEKNTFQLFENNNLDIISINNDSDIVNVFDDKIIEDVLSRNRYDIMIFGVIKSYIRKRYIIDHFNKGVPPDISKPIKVLINTLKNLKKRYKLKQIIVMGPIKTTNYKMENYFNMYINYIKTRRTDEKVDINTLFTKEAIEKRETNYNNVLSKYIHGDGFIYMNFYDMMNNDDYIYFDSSSNKNKLSPKFYTDFEKQFHKLNIELIMTPDNNIYDDFNTVIKSFNFSYSLTVLGIYEEIWNLTSDKKSAVVPALYSINYIDTVKNKKYINNIPNTKLVTSIPFIAILYAFGILIKPNEFSFGKGQMIWTVRSENIDKVSNIKKYVEFNVFKPEDCIKDKNVSKIVSNKFYKFFYIATAKPIKKYYLGNIKSFITNFDIFTIDEI